MLSRHPEELQYDQQNLDGSRKGGVCNSRREDLDDVDHPNRPQSEGGERTSVPIDNLTVLINPISDTTSEKVPRMGLFEPWR